MNVEDDARPARLVALFALAAGAVFGLSALVFIAMLWASAPDPLCPNDESIWFQFVGKAPIVRCFAERTGDAPIWHPPTPSPTTILGG